MPFQAVVYIYQHGKKNRNLLTTMGTGDMGDAGCA